jgi:adenine C2-methylase RlmN of 23S rRNA A2503 and tRNA A37
MYSIHDEEAMINFLRENKFPSFRYAQIENAIYKNFVSDFGEIQTIPKELREQLKENFFYSTLEVDHIVTSSNGQTTKILFKTKS